jgi:hypothetical protein
MVHSFRTILAMVTVVTRSRPLHRSRASASPAPASGPISTGQMTAIGIGVAGSGARPGIAICFAVRPSHSLTGCVSSGPNGLQLQRYGDQRTYALIGVVSALKPGDRVRLSGKKKMAAVGSQPFFVEKWSKDFGACRVEPATP